MKNQDLSAEQQQQIKKVHKKHMEMLPTALENMARPRQTVSITSRGEKTNLYRY